MHIFELTLRRSLNVDFESVGFKSDLTMRRLVFLAFRILTPSRFVIVQTFRWNYLLMANKASLLLYYVRLLI
jgi:hypothetical protein